MGSKTPEDSPETTDLSKDRGRGTESKGAAEPTSRESKPSGPDRDRAGESPKVPLGGAGAAGQPAVQSTLDLPANNGAGGPLKSQELFRLSESTGERGLAQLARIGPYKIVDILGEGGMGIVYLAEQTDPIRRRVAIKVIKLGMDTKEVVARFEAERQAMALMSHPGVAKVLEAGSTEEGRPYFVMEHVPGLPITDYCDRHRLGTYERLALFAKVCDAVQHAHHKGIIHRDIKPTNVLVTLQDGGPVPKVIDFGVAKATNQRLTEKTVYTNLGQIIGTPEYMSPEQAEMSPIDIDTRTDIYSLGVLLYEILVGALPFDSKDLRAAGYQEIQRRIREVDPPRPSARLSTLGEDSRTSAQKRNTEVSALIRQLRGDLDWITMKAMEKDRTRRYASASELAADVLRHLSHEPVLAGAPGAAYRLRKLLQRNKTKVQIVAALLVVIAGMVLVSWLRARAEFRRYLGLAEDALRRESLEEAKGYMGFLEVRSRDHPEVARLARERDGLLRKLQIQRGESLLAEAREAATKYLEHSEQLRLLKEEWKAAAAEEKGWTPHWRRKKDFEAWAKFRNFASDRPGKEDLFQSAWVLFARTTDAFPPEAPERVAARREADDFFRKGMRDVALWGEALLVELTQADASVPPGQAAGTPGAPSPAPAAWKVTLASDPPFDEAFCFRHDLYEERLIPVRFDPRTGVAGRPFLVVEGLGSAAPPEPFRKGDRLMRVGRDEVRVPGDLDLALRDTAAGGAVTVTVLREGREEALEGWIPFPKPAGATLPGAGGGESAAVGSILSIPEQLRFNVSGYPLDFADAFRLAPAAPGASLEVELPAGSYLLVFRKAGHADARCPVVVPDGAGQRKVKLLRRSDVPEGFEYVPGGALAAGTDAGAYEGLEPGRHEVEPFLMARQEVTFRRYLEFLDDPAVFARIDAEGKAEAVADEWQQGEYKVFSPEKKPVQLVPLLKDGRLLLSRDETKKEWKPRMKNFDIDWPVLGVSLPAAVEYAHWLSEREVGGRKWRFRLPRDIEWEWAARGPTKRTFVWGDYPLWSYCRSAKGAAGGAPRPGPVGMFYADESVFGIRDLAGSVSEITLGLALREPLRYVLRGGSWQTSDDRDFRIASRNRRGVESSLEDTGIRLVAEIPPAAD